MTYGDSYINHFEGLEAQRELVLYSLNGSKKFNSGISNTILKTIDTKYSW
jgi:hypothetical protein